MIRHIKLTGIIAALLAILLPSTTLAQGFIFSVSPAEISIDNLPPGDAAEFELTIYNKDEIAHNFTVTTFQPPKEETRDGRTKFPEDSWISLSPQEILGVAAPSSDMLTVKLYARLLVSTTSAVAARPNALLVAGIIVGIVLLGYGGYYYFRRKAKFE